VRDALSCRDVDHTTVYRWAQRDALELDRRCRQSLRATNDSYRIDETYIKIKKQGYSIYGGYIGLHAKRHP
jgi:transposase, IS6 family